MVFILQACGSKGYKLVDGGGPSFPHAGLYGSITDANCTIISMFKMLQIVCYDYSSRLCFLCDLPHKLYGPYVKIVLFSTWFHLLENLLFASPDIVANAAYTQRKLSRSVLFCFQLVNVLFLIMLSYQDISYGFVLARSYFISCFYDTASDLMYLSFSFFQLCLWNKCCSNLIFGKYLRCLYSSQHWHACLGPDGCYVCYIILSMVVVNHVTYNCSFAFLCLGIEGYHFMYIGFRYHLFLIVLCKVRL